MKRFTRDHPVSAFLVIAYGFTGVVFAIPLMSQIGLGLLSIELPGVAPFIVLASVGLTAAAFLVTVAVDGRRGVTELRRRVFRFGVNPIWFPVALVLLPLTALATTVIALGSNPVSNLAANPGLLITILIEALLAFVLVNWWEETAWTGFALHRLQPRFGPIRASILTTWMQATIHLPLLFVVDGVTTGRVETTDIPLYLGALFLLPIPVRLIITWIYNSANNSIPVVGLFHAGLGVATGATLIPAIAPGFDTVWVYAGFGLVAAIVLALSRGRLGYIPEDTSPFDDPTHKTRIETKAASLAFRAETHEAPLQ